MSASMKIFKTLSAVQKLSNSHGLNRYELFMLYMNHS